MECSSQSNMIITYIVSWQQEEVKVTMQQVLIGLILVAELLQKLVCQLHYLGHALVILSTNTNTTILENK